jgi:hypothetical protein
LQGLFLAPLAPLRLHLLTLRLHLLTLRLHLLELRLKLRLKLRLELRLTLRLHLRSHLLPLPLTLVCFSFPPLFAAVAQSSTLRAQSADWGAVMETVMQWESPSTSASTLALPTALPSL